MLKFTTEAQSTQRLPLELFLCDLCASVVRNFHNWARSFFGHDPYKPPFENHGNSHVDA
jgi:hypothetical protein